MKKAYSLLWDTEVEILDADTLLKMMDEVQAYGWHIEDASKYGLFDFMVCFW